MKDRILPADKKSEAQLVQKLASLALLPPKGQASSPLVARISGKHFQMEGNDTGVQSVSFLFRSNDCRFTLKDRNGEYSIVCGLGKWVESETNMPGTPPKLTSGDLGPTSKIAACGTWKDDHTFEMTWRFYETPHHDTVTCRFDDDRVKVEFMNSVTQNLPTRKEKRPVLQGQGIA
jgi:hypothetical protein